MKTFTAFSFAIHIVMTDTFWLPITIVLSLADETITSQSFSTIDHLIEAAQT